MQQHHVAGGALDQGAHRGAAVLAQDEVALPVAGHGPIGDLGGTLRDHHHAGDRAPVVHRGPGATRGPAGAQAGSAPGAAHRGLGRRATGRSSHGSPTSSDRQGTRSRNRWAISSGDHNSFNHLLTWAAKSGQASFGRLGAPGPPGPPRRAPPRPDTRPGRRCRPPHESPSRPTVPAARWREAVTRSKPPRISSRSASRKPIRRPAPTPARAALRLDLRTQLPAAPSCAEQPNSARRSAASVQPRRPQLPRPAPLLRPQQPPTTTTAITTPLSQPNTH